MVIGFVFSIVFTIVLIGINIYKYALRSDKKESIFKANWKYQVLLKIKWEEGDLCHSVTLCPTIYYLNIKYNLEQLPCCINLITLLKIITNPCKRLFSQS